MTKSEKKCKDMADVCELAHNRTIKECKKLGIKWNSKTLVAYSRKARPIFDKHYDYICEVTGL